ncbi:peptidoglycan DD-metalloendopeptidase family protein [Mesorhizobium sp. LHD-90]|uniref:peptidoglycan DD-metalloendopeptidase family protein n=1 Tax=Mesorhizobium sp. LHD-90 TaxID=3071414 RepID=UPI0027DEC0E6|nr:peptidoglycan DD-metalloendopeptidase family protein [Mesorhizobium sp. LHD-90]MDQ6432936.1 peptidoglycan DD-metalloendopeptidase family protein [Mesorhizobium sp. LHD-90]
MLVSVLRSDKRKLWRGAALLLLTGMTAGCSSQFSRFNSTDDIFTGSTANQRQIINGESQPYPGDTAPVAAAPAAPVQTGAVNRNVLPPVSSQPLPAPTVTARSAPAATAPAEQTLRAPVAEAAKPKAAAPKLASAEQLDNKPTGTTEPRMAVEPNEPAGWSRAGGTQVTVKQGETVYNLSRRFGVPANVIAQVNGLPGGGALQTGQKIVIPTYVYSNKAPVSAPDSDPNVADARSSTGTKYDVPANKVPLPSRAPQDKLAVLPQTPKVKESAAPAPLGTTASNEAKPAKAEPVKAAAAKGAYTVESGDTLSKIARKTGVSVTALKAANGMEDGILKIGQTLKVPAAGEAAVAKAVPAVDPVATSAVPAAPKKVAQGETVAAIAPAKKDDKVIEQAEKSEAAAPNSTGIDRMRWPVRGKVISGYGKGGGADKDGIDIAVPEGTPVKAAENGVVIYAGDGLKEFGNTVLVRHENGLVTVYGHASELKVQRGQKVKRGDEIAVSGMSGNANAPKLHFEVRKNSAPVDPSTYLE